MVVFTCNHCGDSLQKPKVDKHYFTTACRKAKKALTCVDCLKDFFDEDYVGHTKCVSEAERYAPKGSFSKGLVKKGEVKQESWTEIIQSVTEKTTNVKAGQQHVLNLLANSTNVPRKKNKFMNFVKSAIPRKASDLDIEEVWDIIEKYKGQQAEKLAAEGENKSEVIKDTTEIDNGKVATENTAGDSKKRKKSKSAEENIAVEENSKQKIQKNVDENSDGANKNDAAMDVIETEEVNKNNTAGESLKKKKKKKSKNVEENGENKPESNSSIAVNGTAVETSEKKNITDVPKIEAAAANGTNGITVDGGKKKKRKSKNVNDSVVENTNSSSNIQLEGEPSKKKKKKLETSTENGMALDNPISQQIKVQNGEESTLDVGNNTKTKEKKSKKSLTEDTKNSEEKKTQNGISNNDGPVSDEHQENSSKFFYEGKILEILKTKNSMSLKKLQKKVLGAYQKVTGAEPTEKVIKKFNKHLKKISGIELSENTVTFISG